MIINHSFDKKRHHYIDILNNKLNEKNYKPYQTKLLLDFGMEYYHSLNILLDDAKYLSSNIYLY